MNALLKSSFTVLSRIAPGLVVKLAMQKLNNPQVRKMRAHEEAMLQTAQQSQLSYKGGHLQQYSWGSGSRSLLLIHGWEGHAGNFADMIEGLVEADFTIHAFDAPSHGRSSKRSTDFFDFAEALALIMDKVKPSHLISHSFGGVATTIALNEFTSLPIERYALLTTPDTFLERIDQVSLAIGISDTVKHTLIAKLEQDYNRPISGLSVSKRIAGLDIKKGLILHGREDKVIPLVQSQRVANAWPASTIEVLEGTGHFRILRSPDVTSRLLDFLKN